MSSQELYPKGSPDSFEHKQQPESPFLNEELFADIKGQTTKSWPSHLDGDQAESPFQYAFDQEQEPFHESGIERSNVVHDEVDEEFLVQPAKANVKHFLCSEADQAQVERILERSISLDDLRSAVESTIADVVSWSTKAANGLSRSRRRHSISNSGSTEQLFHESFGTSPGYVPKWRPSGQKWDRGDIVRIRLKRAVKVLSGGSLKFFCWGPNQRPDMPWKPTSNSGFNAKKYEIYFGQGFWEAWKNGDSASMGSTLLMSALAIYYDTVSYFGNRSRYGNSHCYARFVLHTNGFTDLPDRVKKRCEPAVPPDVKQILKKINDAIHLLKKSEKFLKTQAQQELLKEIISEMSWFFQDGHYGIKNEHGEEAKASRRYRIELLVPQPNRSNQPFFFHHDTRLYLSHEVNQRIGDHKTMGAHRSQIRLYIPNLITRSPDSVAGHLIHEMLHMMRSRFRGIESKYDRSTARSIPTKAAGALLDLSALNSHRQKMLQYFTTLINFLKLDRSLAATFADHVLEEILAYVFTTRIRDAIAENEAEQSGIGISLSFDPVQFLQVYLKRYWLPHPELREALKTNDGQKILRDMDNDLKQLKEAVEKHIDNPASSAPQSDKEINLETDISNEEAAYNFDEDIDEAEQEQFTDFEFNSDKIDREDHPTALVNENLLERIIEQGQPILVEPEEPYGQGSLDEELFYESEVGIIDGDNRVQVKKTIGVPWRWICQITIRDNQGRNSGHGTGVLISDRHVLTAAHIVDKVANKPFAYSIEVTPALNYDKEPFGTYIVSAKPKIPSKYTKAKGGGKTNWDYALLTLSKRVGEKTFSSLGGKPLCHWGHKRCGQRTRFERLNPRELNTIAAYTAGYPGNRGGKKLMCAAGIILGAHWRGRLMSITADTTKGQSGSPVWIKEKNRYYLVGIAAGGGEHTNIVVRVTQELIRQVRAWIIEDGDTPAMSEPEIEEPFAPDDAEFNEEDLLSESEETELTDGKQPEYRETEFPYELPYLSHSDMEKFDDLEDEFNELEDDIFIPDPDTELNDEEGDLFE